MKTETTAMVMGGGVDTKLVNTSTNIKNLFDFSGAKAIASVKDEGNRAARAGGTGITSPLVKVFADGRIEDALKLPDGLSISNTTIDSIYESPVNNDIFILFAQRPWYNGNVKTVVTETYVSVDEEGNEVLDEEGNPVTITKEVEKSEWQSGSISQLIHVKEDGSYVELLAGEQQIYTQSRGWGIYEPVRFDELGNIYYVAYEWLESYCSSAVYKYNPKTGITSQLTAAVKGVQYNVMQISKDGNWIFVEGNNYNGENSTNFLRAIPTTNPNTFDNIFYSTGNSSEWLKSWYYSDATHTVYYSGGQNDINGTLCYGLWKLKLKGGKFDKANRELIRSNGGSNSKMYWSKDVRDANGDVDIDKVYDYISERAAEAYQCSNNNSYSPADKWNNFRTEWNKVYEYTGTTTIYNYDWSPDTFDSNGNFKPKTVVDHIKKQALNRIGNYWDDSTEEWKSYTAEDLEIRFEKFKDITGYEELAQVTKNADGTYMADEEAFEALYNASAANILGNLYSEGRYNYVSKLGFSGYEHSFLNDILYWADSEKTEEIISEDSYTSSETFLFLDLDNRTSTSYSNYTWNTTDYTNKEILNMFFNLCNVKGEKELRLTSFKGLEIDGKDYSILYSEKTDEDAIKWIKEDEYRTSIFIQFINYYMDWYGTYSYLDDRNGLEYLCFIKGTDTPAYNGNNDTNPSLDDLDLVLTFKEFENIEGLEGFAEMTKTSYGTYKTGKDAIATLVENDKTGIHAATAYSCGRYKWNSIDRKYEHSFLSDIIRSKTDGSAVLSTDNYGGAEIIYNLFQWDDPSVTATSVNASYQYDDIQGFFDRSDGSIWCAIRGYSDQGNKTYIMKLFDESEELVTEVPSAMNELSPISFKVKGDVVYIKNSIITDGTNSGNQNIYSFDGTNLVNLFDTIANGSNMEIYDYSVGDEFLYYTGVVGTFSATGKINRKTGINEVIECSQKLSHIFSIK